MTLAVEVRVEAVIVTDRLPVFNRCKVNICGKNNVNALSVVLGLACIYAVAEHNEVFYRTDLIRISLGTGALKTVEIYDLVRKTCRCGSKPSSLVSGEHFCAVSVVLALEGDGVLSGISSAVRSEHGDGRHASLSGGYGNILDCESANVAVLNLNEGKTRVGYVLNGYLSRLHGTKKVCHVRSINVLYGNIHTTSLVGTNKVLQIRCSRILDNNLVVGRRSLTPNYCTTSAGVLHSTTVNSNVRSRACSECNCAINFSV